MLWSVDGIFNHSAELDAEGNIWAPYRLARPEQPGDRHEERGRRSLADGVEQRLPDRAVHERLALLNAIGDAHGIPVMLQAKGVMKHLYGVEDFLSLKKADHTDYIAKLRVWLEEPNHEHVEQYLADGVTLICERCGVAAVPAEAPSGEQAPLV